MKPSKFGAMISMSSSEPTVNECLDVLERHLYKAFQRCKTPSDVKDLLAHLILSSEQWCNQPRVDRSPWMKK